jgi:ABC-type nitrate/sulfonate/bicarbonate transport system substrate-binding protein
MQKIPWEATAMTLIQIRSRARRIWISAQTRKTAGHTVLVTSLGLALAAPAGTNPYLAKPTEVAQKIRVATCAISGGFMHLYTAVDQKLFNKYGLQVEFISISGSGISLAALSSHEIDLLYCAGEATIPGLASGVEAKLVAAPLIGLPWVVLARKDIKRPEDLKGLAIGINSPGRLIDRLAKDFVKRFNLANDVRIRPVGGQGQLEPYNAMKADIVQAALVTPPLEVRGQRDGFNVIFDFRTLDASSIYSALQASTKVVRERPGAVQRFVAGMAEAVHFVENNPDRAKQSVSKILRLDDEVALGSAYQAYARSIVNRSLLIPGNAVAEGLENARAIGANVKKKPEELFDNTFAHDLEKSGFLKELWGTGVKAK